MPNLYVMGAVALLILGLLSGMFYFKAEAANNLVKVTEIQATLDKRTLENKALRKNSEQVTRQMNEYTDRLIEVSQKNAQLNIKLQTARSKLASHDLGKMRDRRSGLTLKIINGSIPKMHKAWMQ